MTPDDRARAAERLLGDPLAMALLDSIERDAIEAMLTEEAGIFCFRDKALAVRELRHSLKREVSLYKASQKKTDAPV